MDKKAFFIKQVSAIIENKTQVKYKDLKCPSIYVPIRGFCIELALLDLGESVNLPPYSIYKLPWLGELKSIHITISLTKILAKLPRGIVDDILVQVNNFYYLVDFVVLDSEPVTKELNLVPLGRPFLVVTNALLSYWNGCMKIMFGDKTLELTYFTHARIQCHLKMKG